MFFQALKIEIVQREGMKYSKGPTQPLHMGRLLYHWAVYRNSGSGVVKDSHTVESEIFMLFDYKASLSVILILWKYQNAQSMEKCSKIIFINCVFKRCRLDSVRFLMSQHTFIHSPLWGLNSDITSLCLCAFLHGLSVLILSQYLYNT